MSTDLRARERTGLLLVDLQNDFLHPEGAYARGGVSSPALAAVAPAAASLAAAARRASVPVIASRFTLWPGRSGAPIIPAHLLELRPFLSSGGFEPGSWGQSVLDEIGPADATVDKVAYSAFAHTRLGWWCERVGVDHLVVGGIVTNGGVASTVHDAHVRGLDVTLVADGCAAIDAGLHDATLRSLGSVASVVPADDVIRAWQ